jgi:hypothetical protein
MAQTLRSDDGRAADESHAAACYEDYGDVLFCALEERFACDRVMARCDFAALL